MQDEREVGQSSRIEEGTSAPTKSTSAAINKAPHPNPHHGLDMKEPVHLKHKASARRLPWHPDPNPPPIGKGTRRENRKKHKVSMGLLEGLSRSSCSNTLRITQIEYKASDVRDRHSPASVSQTPAALSSLPQSGLN